MEVFIPQQAFKGNSFHQVVRRVAFDIGSGVVRMQIADVDFTANKIVNVLCIHSIRVALREDLIKSSDQRLSVDIQNQMVRALLTLMERATSFNPQDYYAVATEALRLAKNADSLIGRIKKETGLTITIISQKEEGVLGFLSAVNGINIHDVQNLVAWDVGGGSFQITTKNDNDYFVYEDQLGATVFLNTLLKIQGKSQLSSPNPIAKEIVNQALQFINNHLKQVPFEIRQKLSHSDVIVLGMGINPLWYSPGELTFTQDQLLSEIEQQLDLNDQELRMKNHISPTEASFHIVSNLILIYGIMKALDIRHVRYAGTKSANAVGVLLSAKYWQNQKDIACDLITSDDAR